MYNITGARYDDKTRKVVGYVVSDGNTRETLSHNLVYWMIKAGLIQNATAREDGDQLIVETDAIMGSKLECDELNDKSNKLYETIRVLNKEYRFDMNNKDCKVKITGAVYKYRTDNINTLLETNIMSKVNGKENDISDLIDYIGFEVKNIGTSLVYYVTYDINTKKCGMDIINPGETVVLSEHAVKLLLAQKNVVCTNGYLTYDTFGTDAEPTMFDIDDDVLFRTTHEIERKRSFNSFGKTIMSSLLSKDELEEQLELIA